MKETRGFTLIELLVVIAIIGLLATMAVVSFGGAQKKARDARRKADLAQISKALELFFDEAGTYPGEGCATDSSNTDATCVIGSASTWNAASGFTATIKGHNISEFINPPVDPLNDATHFYQYEPHCILGGGGIKGGYWVRAFMEETSSWYYIKGGTQEVDPDCLAKCPGAGSAPCY